MLINLMFMFLVLLSIVITAFATKHCYKYFYNKKIEKQKMRAEYEELVFECIGEMSDHARRKLIDGFCVEVNYNDKYIIDMYLKKPICDIEASDFMENIEFSVRLKDEVDKEKQRITFNSNRGFWR